MADPRQEALGRRRSTTTASRGPGKLEIRATKPLANGRDLARAYSPGVAEACLEIKADPAPPRSTRAARTSSPSCRTAPPCWALATSARWPRSR
jgi:malic enzyme